MANLGSFFLFFFNPDIKIASSSACCAVVFLLNVHPLRCVGSFGRERGEYRNYIKVVKKWENNQVCLWFSAFSLLSTPENVVL